MHFDDTQAPPVVILFMFYRQVLGLGHRKSPKELYDAIGKLLPTRLKALHCL